MIPHKKCQSCRQAFVLDVKLAVHGLGKFWKDANLDGSWRVRPVETMPARCDRCGSRIQWFGLIDWATETPFGRAEFLLAGMNLMLFDIDVRIAAFKAGLKEMR